MHQAINGSGSQQELLNQHNLWSNLKLNLPGALEELQNLSGNTGYERLDCLGLEYTLDRLVATFHIKQSSGYSGNLCTAGSTEYVTFWTDWDDNCTWTLLGTVQTTVHDIPNIPKDGLAYSAVYPVSIESIIQSCDQPKIARVRAVLSWGVSASTTDPDAIPTWGNILDAHVQIRPGIPATGPSIWTIGGIGLAGFWNSGANAGLTNGGTNAVFDSVDGSPADQYNRYCPFGGDIIIAGIPLNLPNVSYRVMVQCPSNGVAAYPLTTQFSIPNLQGVISVANPALSNGWLTYLDAEANVSNILGVFQSSVCQFPDALWYVGLEYGDPNASPNPPSTWYPVQLDNTAPNVFITTTAPTGCGEIAVGQEVKGYFWANDLHFGSWSLGVSPNGTITPPGIPSTTEVLTGDESEQWTMATATLVPCGYVASVFAVDLSIMDSLPGIHNARGMDVGFCLTAPPSNNSSAWEVVEE